MIIISIHVRTGAMNLFVFAYNKTYTMYMMTYSRASE